MTSVPNASAAAYQYFKVRSLAGNSQKSGEAATHTHGTLGDATLDAARSSQRVGDASSSDAAAPLDPSHIKTRIDRLVDDQITAGKLTPDQGNSLKQVLSQAALQSTGGSTNDEANVPGKTTAVVSAPAQSSKTYLESKSDPYNSVNPSELLASFIQSVQKAQSKSSSYASDGSVGPTAPRSSLLDFGT